MGKQSRKTIISPPPVLPKAPVIYLNDPTTDIPHARYLRDMIGSCIIAFHSPDDVPTGSTVSSAEVLTADLRNGYFDHSVVIINDNLTDSKAADKLSTATHCREETIKHGCNFASVNLYLKDGTPTEDLKSWGTNHLDLCVANLTVKEVAEKVYRWLFTVLTVLETLHLIPDSELRATDVESFPDYAYSPINQSKSRPKDEKIQFVAVIISKPVVGPNQRLHWTVADKTGTANFYFQYRGPSSQYTWDWVLKLQPGDRTALPRMPMVEIKERKRVRIAKAPLRSVGFVVGGMGLAIRSVGHGVLKLGDLVALGKSSEWVPEADVVDGKKVNWSKVFEKEHKDRLSKIEKAQQKVPVKVFSEKGVNLWKDDDSDASTEAGSKEIREKEFC